jgi:DNA helicase-2/ATP-dependent DNA helicase PcrA
LSFYQRKEIKDILSYFRLIINTKDDESFKRIINWPARGIGTTTLDRLEVSAAVSGCSIYEIANFPDKMILAGLNSGVIRKISAFTRLINEFSEQSGTTGAFDIANKIASEFGILTELYQDNSPENLSRYENIQELLNAIRNFSLNAVEEGQTDSLQVFMEDVALLTDQDNEKQEDKNKVTLMTVHSSKGLEFKNVFIVGLEENLFPSGFSGTLTLFELEEERRLFYVALTRSQNQAWLTFAQQRFRWGKAEFCNPSRFIGEIDHQFLDIRNSRQIPQFRNQEINTYQRGHYPQTDRSGYQPARKSELPGGRMQVGKSILPSLSSPFESDSPERISVGMFVEHERFGRGKVMNIEGKMPDLKARVFFPTAGEKNLLLKFAKLRISDEKE